MHGSASDHDSAQLEQSQRIARAGTVVHEEYKVGDFLRSFILSDEVDHDRISARLNNGVLRVELPRASRSQPRRIEVTTD